MKILRLLIPLALLLALSACGSSSEGGAPGLDSESDQVSTKVFNGSPVTFPQVVLFAFEFPDGGIFTCTGTIIGSHAILTAGHCLNIGGVRAINAAVRVQGVVLPIVEAGKHPGYLETPTAIFKDVAVVKTAGPLGVPPFPILASVPVSPGAELSIFGYGETETGSSGSPLGGTITIEAVGPPHLMDRSVGPQNTCVGDSGGPAIAFVDDPNGDGRIGGIVGITSFSFSGGRSCFGSGGSVAYTNMQNFNMFNWVASVVPTVLIF